MSGALTKIYVPLSILIMACGGTGNGSASSVSAEANAPKETVKYVKGLKLQLAETNLAFNQKLDIKFEAKDLAFDSVQYFYNGRRIATTGKDTFSYMYEIPATAGIQSVKIIAYLPDNKRSTSVKAITVKPQNPPKRLSYKVLNVYPHDRQAYTQGLLLHNGFMYEGTGKNGMSGIRKYRLEDGNVLQNVDLEDRYFGEGITIVGNRIFQLTWQRQTGFVYDLETMNQLSTFSYNTEGWGLTHTPDEQFLVMSDGSNELTFRAIRNFGDIVKTVYVYDNEEPIRNLNELEYIDGRIWANVWQSDRIVVINPETGAVEADLDLSDILLPSEKAALTPQDEVLNGIAYNAATGTLLVTGKNWPKMFEIKVESWK